MKSMRSAGSPVKLKPTMLCVLSAVAALCAIPSPANAGGVLPGGGRFVAGNGSIAGNGTTLTIQQNSPHAVINWDSFSIGKGNDVTFYNGTGATLNRVTGGNPTSILGSLLATGALYLINPQGIVIGRSGTVSTGGRFVASTLDTDNASFMNGGPIVLSGSSNAKVVNLGNIGSTLGQVFLIASNEVDNLGTIHAANSTAELAAGQRVLLQDSSTGKQVFVQLGSKGTVLNRGSIEAAQISLQAADGNVFALSGNHEALRATGTAKRDGHIWLVADTGTVNLGGSIEAKNADGSGGTVDTNAGYLAFCHCGPTVSAGAWNIVTPNFWLGDTAAKTFSRSLTAGTSINVQTTGAGRPNGDIDVASSIGWNGAASLNLGSYHDLRIDKGVTIQNQGSGNLTLRADASAIDNGGSVLNSGIVDWSNSTGIVSAYYDMNGSYLPGTQRSNASWTSPAYSGLASQITGYRLVNSLADLENINSDLAGNYALGRDIDAGTTIKTGYVPLGGGNTAFTGQFDGQGHTIDSLTMQATGAQTWAMFANLGKRAVVRDLNLNAIITPYDLGNGILALLAGDNEGTILRVNTSGSVGGLFATAAGGLVGINRGAIWRSSSSASVAAGGPDGGLVGENDGVIAQSSASGTVSQVGVVLGGIAGSPGGLVGTNNGTITQSYATGRISDMCNWGQCGDGAALVYLNQGTISQSFATGAAPFGVAADNRGTIANDVYWDKGATGTSIGVGYGTAIPSTNGLTTAQMSNPASFAGWNFGPGGDWVMPAGMTHPVLAWQVSPANSR